MRRLAALAALALGASAMAQTPPAPAPSPQAVAAAGALYDLQQQGGPAAASEARRLADMRSGAALAKALERSPQFRLERAKNKPGFEDALKRAGGYQADAWATVFAQTRSATRAATVQALARNFSPAELEQLLAFYRAPLGRKLLTTLPRVQAEAAAAVQRQVAPKAQAAFQAAGPRIDAELRKILPPPPGAAPGTAPGKGGPRAPVG